MRNLPLEQHYRDARCGSVMLPWSAEVCLELPGALRPLRRARGSPQCLSCATSTPRRSPGARRAPGRSCVFLHGLGMTRIGFDPQLAALAAGYRCVAWDMPGYGASPMPAGGLTFPLLADARRRPDRDPRRAGRARRRPLDGRPDRAAHGAAPPRARALARAARLEPGLRPRRHRPGSLEARCGSMRSTPAQTPACDGRARAALDHGAGRRRRRGRRGRRLDGAHLVRRACARRSSACRRTTCATASARSPRRRSCWSASSTRRRRRPTPRRSPTGIPGATLAIVPGAGHISNLEAPDAVNAALLRSISTRSRRRDDRVALDRRLRRATCARAR